MEALVLVGGTLLVWTVGFWAVGQLDRFFKEKKRSLPEGAGGADPQKKKSSVPERGKKRRDRGKTRGGAQTVFLHSLGPSCIRNRSTTAETKKSGLAVSIFRGRWAGPLQRLQFALPPLLTGSGVGSLNAHFAVPWGCRTCSMRCPPRGSRAGARICSA